MERHTSLEPSPWVVEHAPRVPSGTTVLDVAAGAGRHAHLFADRGHSVVAVDRDTTRVSPRPEIRVVCADIEVNAWPFDDDRFGAVIVTNYLWRPLFGVLMDAVVEGGVLIYETFAVGNERLGRPSNPDYLLREDELSEVVTGRFEVVAFEQGEIDVPKPAVVQRICAVRRVRVSPATSST